MLEAYRDIEIALKLDGEQIVVEVPFTVGLLEQVEKATAGSQKRRWWSSQEKNLVDNFRAFCEPYLPDDFDHKRAQPTFYALFFSSVRREVERSFTQCISDMVSTEESEKRTEENQVEA